VKAGRTDPACPTGAPDLFSHSEVSTLGGVTLALKAIDALLVELGSAPA
jgi:hypothetical protein